MLERRQRLLFLVAEDWYFVSHRLGLARAAAVQGFEVTVVTRFSTHRQAIEAAGLRTVAFDMNRRGLNPVALLREAVRLAPILRRERPDLVHLVALRPIVVGGLAVRFAGVKRVVSAVAGMGFLFTESGRLPWARWAVQKMLPWLLSRGSTIVQNGDDSRELVALGLSPDRVREIRGAGVDTAHFVPADAQTSTPVVMLAARLLWDKGVGEFVEAARRLRDRGVRFVLVGPVDEGNPASVGEGDLKDWVADGVVEWWGRSDDMVTTLVQADLVCLPSYREGLPKVLLEAMACGKACITTDVPGCREVVSDGDNGLLVPAKDVAALTAAIAELLDHPQRRIEMGARGRARAVSQFSQERVIEATLTVYREALASDATRNA